MSGYAYPELQGMIRQALKALASRQVFVGVSGGLDSACLLHLAARSCPPEMTVRAVHVNHQLHEDAGTLQQACQILCDALSVPLDVMTVEVDRSSGRGIEAAAREARYQAFNEVMGAGDVLWLAHHLDDQAETVLLRLLRGSGVDGLGAMAEKRDAAGGFRVERPLLSVSRTQLEAYACHHRLHFHDDPTNEDMSLDRNYLRHQVMPLLMARWPQAAGAMASSAHQAREASALMADWSGTFLETIMPVPGVLDIAGLKAQEPAARRVLIRSALARVKLPMPPRARLESLLEQLEATGNALPCVVWPGAEARCWRGRLYLEAPATSLPPDWCVEWTSGVALDTPLGRWHGELLPLLAGPVPQGQASARRGGEQLYLRGHHRRLKTLLQEAGVPPWQRTQCVVLSVASRPVALIFPPHSDRAPLVADHWQLMQAGWSDGLPPQA
ncbi:tRNA lysidine(34) synthetase TilS [Larsenimonas rhizosphaerae]|uniref:tRNA lysidine(34) synthetase TilS n=1 Tax=Larsenimonas rhizosphaerae TaxID=2944682 RepID=UPI0020349229|nr:tRNA lysidine(34) synthetase TilS [Larsenimonas rhizosphaerae]MCM2129679.1 tRNA lysidine(34) synthetase TilS [Larsenimonas rhizosphaerae]